MPRIPDARFPLPEKPITTHSVVDLLGGVVHKRPPTGEEALAHLNRLESLARHGNLDARVELAYHHLHNAGQQSNTNRTIMRLVRPAADAHHVEGMYLLGLLMLRGQGCPQNLQEGAELIEKAAFQGHLGAQKLLARLFAQGWGRDQNQSQALYWYRLAAGQDDQEALRETGLYYLYGIGCPADEQKGAGYLERAARLGDSFAQYELYKYFRKQPTDEDKAQAQFWLNESALAGDLDAQFRQGLQCWSGQGGKSVNLREALRWTCRAAEGGNIQAVTTLAGFFVAGNILPVNLNSAYMLALFAERQGNATAQMTRQSLESMLTYRAKRRCISSLKHFSEVKPLVEALIPRDQR